MKEQTFCEVQIIRPSGSTRNQDSVRDLLDPGSGATEPVVETTDKEIYSSSLMTMINY